jgi:hypothetical protein
MRSKGECSVCGEFREIVSRGRCARCLGKAIRAQRKVAEGDSLLLGPDRSQSREQKELNKARVNFARMVSLMDEAVTNNLILPDEEYVLINDCLIEAIDRINGMQKQVNDVNPGPELTSTSTTEELTLTPPTELTALTDPALLTPDDPDQEPPQEPAFQFKVHPMSKSGDARHDGDDE